MANSDHFRRLELLARRRLWHLSELPGGTALLARGDPRDYLMQAIIKVLEGDQKRRGRRPQRHHLRSPNAFANYMRGVLMSIISHEWEQLRRQGIHVSLEADDTFRPPPAVTAKSNVFRDVHLREMRRVLFSRLYQLTELRPSLMPVVTAWEECFELDDRIPKGNATDKAVCEVRQLARSILDRLARHETSGINGGAELFGP